MSTEQQPPPPTTRSHRWTLWRRIACLLGCAILVGEAIWLIKLRGEIHTSKREIPLLSHLPQNEKEVSTLVIPSNSRVNLEEQFAKARGRGVVSAHIRVDEFWIRQPDHWRLRPEHRTLDKFDFLRTLIVSPAFIQREDLKYMPVIPSVEKLVIGNSHSVCSDTCQINATYEPPPSDQCIWNGADLEFLRGFVGVRDLRLRALWLGPGALNVILSLPKLELLELHDCRFPITDIPTLPVPRQLRSLRLLGEPVNADVFAWVAKFKQLREFDLVLPRRPYDEPLDLTFVPQQIETLRLNGARLNGDAWKRIASLPSLRVLTVRGARVELDSSHARPKLTKLRWLDVCGLRQTSDDDFITLLKAAGDHCEILVGRDPSTRFEISARVRSKVNARVFARLRVQPRADLEHNWGY